MDETLQEQFEETSAEAVDGVVLERETIPALAYLSMASLIVNRANIFYAYVWNNGWGALIKVRRISRVGGAPAYWDIKVGEGYKADSVSISALGSSLHVFMSGHINAQPGGNKCAVSHYEIKNAIVPLVPMTRDFTDVPQADMFYPFAKEAVERGIISGYADGSFRPGGNVTRAQLAKMIIVALRGGD
jgi:hypothetical protein